MSEREKIKKIDTLFKKIIIYEVIMAIITLLLAIPMIQTQRGTLLFKIEVGFLAICSVSIIAYIVTDFLYLGYRLSHKNPYDDSLWES